MKIFAKNIKKYRTEKGISQDELAKKVGIHPTHLSRYERGLSVPSVEVAQKLSEVLKMSLDELILENPKEQMGKAIQDRELLGLFSRVQILDQPKQQTIKDLITAFLFKEDVQQELAS